MNRKFAMLGALALAMGVVACDEAPERTDEQTENYQAGGRDNDGVDTNAE